MYLAQLTVILLIKLGYTFTGFQPRINTVDLAELFILILVIKIICPLREAFKKSVKRVTLTLKGRVGRNSISYF